VNVRTGEVDDDVIDWRCKGFPPAASGLTVSRFVSDRPSLFDAGFSWPVMALRESALANNIGALARWCTDHEISLAPHGKTTMTPSLFARQLAAGAWGMTAATPWQVRAYRAFGVPRILLANELVDAGFVSWLGGELRDPGFEFICYVDSVEGVELLAAALRTAQASRPLQVVVEVGVTGGRTGVRSDDGVVTVARAATEFPEQLSLVGIAGYEGPFGHGRDDATLGAVRDFVTRLGRLLAELDALGLLDQRAAEYVLTCGGSGDIDVVTEALCRALDTNRPVRRLLRSGSYVTHDDGLYARTSSLAQRLQPAIEVWCQVLSRPEPTLALLNAGRRDLPFDAGLPVPLLRRTAAGAITPLRGVVEKLNDQHAFVDLAPAEALEVGDLVCLGISHPCTAHDKWQLVPVLDDERRVVDCVRSYF
jgi:D-serine deaminase-like pyridoxal phosphate-dependent protein